MATLGDLTLDNSGLWGQCVLKDGTHGGSCPRVPSRLAPAPRPWRDTRVCEGKWGSRVGWQRGTVRAVRGGLGPMGGEIPRGV